jgi:uncharacterized protein involved in outer membrane biogenesis
MHNLSTTLHNVDFAVLAGSAYSVTATGDFTADSLRFGTIEATNVKTKLRIVAKEIFFEQTSAEAHGGRATGDLSFNLMGQTNTFSSNARVTGVDVAHLLAAFPDGRGKMTGRMEADLKIAGEIEHTTDPLAGIHGTGHLAIHSGKLPTLKLNENLMKLARFNNHGAGAQDPASFSSISADLELANQRISSRGISVVGYGVDFQCAGSLGAMVHGGLDFQGVAKILTKQGFFTNVMARFSGGKVKDGKISFPVRIGGTFGNPTYSVIH